MAGMMSIALDSVHKTTLADLRLVDDPITAACAADHDAMAFRPQTHLVLTHPRLSKGKTALTIDPNIFTAYYQQVALGETYFARSRISQDKKLALAAEALLYQAMLENKEPCFVQDGPEGPQVLTQFKGAVSTMIVQATELFGSDTVDTLHDYIQAQRTVPALQAAG